MICGAEGGVWGSDELIVPVVFVEFVADIVEFVEEFGVGDVNFVGVDTDDWACRQ